MKETDFYSERKKGIIGTVVFHAIVLIALMIFGFFTPLPLPGEEGILVNFGDSKNGLGQVEPSPARKRKQQAPTQKATPSASTPKKQTPPPPATKKAASKPAKKEAMTQDYEKTVAIDAEQKKREAERLKQEKIAKEKREKEARIAKAEAQRKAKEEAERKKKEAQEQQIAAINSRTQGAFSNGGNGNGGTGNGKDTSQGVTFPGGNQGVPTGSSNSNNYGNGGSGSGDSGSGISYSLSGRTAKALPKPHYPGDDEGLVVVRVKVDNSGNVIYAEPGAKGTTIANQAFWNEAKQAAMKAKFNLDHKAPASQIGTISYKFVLN